MSNEREGKHMEELVTSFVKLPVYTRDGIYVGNVKSVLLDVEQKRVASLLLTKTNPSVVEGAIDVAVPYRWVNAIGDIVILSYFPQKVKLGQNEENPSMESEGSAEIETIDEPIVRE